MQSNRRSILCNSSLLQGRVSVRSFQSDFIGAAFTKNILPEQTLNNQEWKSLLRKKLWGIFWNNKAVHEFYQYWSDEEFIRQMKELIGNEGDIHVTCNQCEGE